MLYAGEVHLLSASDVRVTFGLSSALFSWIFHVTALQRICVTLVVNLSSEKIWLFQLYIMIMQGVILPFLKMNVVTPYENPTYPILSA